MPNRVIMHVDLDYFYAQCEENRNPAIRGKPVVVCVYSGRTEESGVVSTSNYPARKYGVKAGIPIARAKRLLESVPEATFLRMDRPFYEGVSERIMEILRANADLFEKMGIDEAYLDVSEKTNHNFEGVERTAREVKQEVLAQERITCSVGVAVNKLVAKIASDERKPDGLTIIRPENVAGFLEQLPAIRIPGVGRKVEEKLDQLKIKTIANLAEVAPSILVEEFGRSLGSYLYRAARGEDDEPVKEREQPTQLSRIVTLKRDTRELREIVPRLEELADSIAGKLKDRRITCKSVSIVAILNNLSIHSKSKTLEQPTSDGKTIANAANELMKQFLDSTPTIVLRRAGVRVTDLSKTTGQMAISEFLKPA